MTQDKSTGLSTGVAKQAGLIELQQSQLAAKARAEIEGALTIAAKFGRDESVAYQGMIRCCDRPSFQAIAEYRFPRGNKDITGASVYLAREFARLWGNMQWGFEIVSETDESIHVRAFAWDLVTNSKTTQDASFKKLIQRKVGRGNDRTTQWVRPDERDLRELVNRHGAIAVRNCLLQLLPTDMVDDVRDLARDNLQKNIADNLEETRKKVIAAFARYRVSASELEKHIGHGLTEATAEELADLRAIWQSIKDGNSRWSEYANSNPVPSSANGAVSAEDIVKPRGVKDSVGPTEAEIEAAEMEGEKAFAGLDVISDCPYPDGVRADAWKKGFDARWWFETGVRNGKETGKGMVDLETPDGLGDDNDRSRYMFRSWQNGVEHAESQRENAAGSPDNGTESGTAVAEEEVSPVKNYIDAIAAARHLNQVTAAMRAATEDARLTDEQYADLSGIAEERQDAIRKEKAS